MVSNFDMAWERVMEGGGVLNQQQSLDDFRDIGSEIQCVVRLT